MRAHKWHLLLIMLATAASCTLPVILYDPRWQGSTPSDSFSGFDWSFCGGACTRVEPVQTSVWIVCLLAFGSASHVLMVLDGFYDGVWRSRRSMLYYVVEFVVSSGLVLLCVYLGWNSAYVDPFPPPSPPPPSWPPLNPTAVARALG